MILQFCKYYSIIPCNHGSSFLSGIIDSLAMNANDSPYRYIFYGLLIVAFVYLVTRSQTKALIKTRKLLRENEEILDRIGRRKTELELKGKDITESLVYAQKIQEAMLPSQDYFRSHFKDSFILFKPKDIIGGDFYWIGEKGDKIFVVAADCTGHGVPGALVSMIGLEIINRTINDDNIEDPSRILGIMNRGLEKTFSSGKNIGNIIHDGMDIGLCVINRISRKIEYSSAFFPLYIIRDNNLIEIKGDKIIIGMNPLGNSYTNHQVDILENDILYIFSDGYVDQFGGTDNKKFMYRRFRHLLMTIHRFPVSDQKSILEENIRTWMGSNPQVDDIMVIGFKPFGEGH